MDYYSVLDIPKTASPDEIKKAYRKLAIKHHPDRSGGDDAQFKKIQEAYDVLGDPLKKQQYDNPFTNHQNFTPFGANGMDAESFFNQVFGARPQNHKQTFRTSVTISLIDAYKGSTHVLQLTTPFGTKVINITVPPGIETGDSIRYDDIIENAILLVQFVVLPDLRFDRKGKDLYSYHSVSVLDLIVGTKFKFVTIDQRTLEVKIAPKTQPYMQLKISKAGMPDKKNDFGDQIILLKPYVPDIIDQEIVDAINNYLNKQSHTSKGENH
jgi:curved DNA-binding protein